MALSSLCPHGQGQSRYLPVQEHTGAHLSLFFGYFKRMTFPVDKLQLAHISSTTQVSNWINVLKELKIIIRNSTILGMFSLRAWHQATWTCNELLLVFTALQEYHQLCAWEAWSWERAWSDLTNPQVAGPAPESPQHPETKSATTLLSHHIQVFSICPDHIPASTHYFGDYIPFPKT